jgi:hypothetical protein
VKEKEQLKKGLEEEEKKMDTLEGGRKLSFQVV